MSGPAMRPEWVAPHRTALLLVDMQVDFARPEGAMGRAGVDLSAVPAALARAESLAAAARQAGVAVIFVGLETASEDDLAAWRESSIRRGADPDRELALCRRASPGALFVGPQPLANELVVRKRRYSGFFGTALETELRARTRDTVVVCGLTTECCVALTAFDAFQRGFHTLLASDACAAYGEDVHRGALHALEINGVVVARAARIIAAWGLTPGQARP